jgi:hypothetical protein
VAPPRGLDRARSPTGFRKLEEKAEQIVDSYLRAGEQGDWRALDALVNRVYGKATETIVTEPARAPWEREMDEMSIEQLEEFIKHQRAEHLRAVEDEVLRRTIEDEKRRAHRLAHPEPRRPEGMSKDETLAWKREQPWYKDNKGKQLRAVDAEEAV